MDQVTTFTLFRFSGWKNKFFALKNMAQFVPACKEVKGLKFIKLMGSGRGDGFSVLPDLRQYVLMCVWQNEDDAEHFFKNSAIFKDYVAHTAAFQTLYMKTTMVHGLWGGINPFSAEGSLFVEDNMVAVLTRATIRWKDMVRFWKDVPAVSDSLSQGPRPIFAAGVGELPFRYQATFSIWKNSHEMKAFAYKTKAHAEMVTKTRKVGWYSEELFARFVIYRTVGEKLVGLQ